MSGKALAAGVSIPCQRPKTPAASAVPLVKGANRRSRFGLGGDH